MAPRKINYFDSPYPENPTPSWESLYGDPFGSLSGFKSVMTGKSISKGSGNDKISGTNGHDLVKAGGGNDWIGPMNGNDWVDAGAGADTVKAGGGHDFVLGGDGNDLIYGESGNDIIEGGRGANKLYGGTGNDVLSDKGNNSLLDGGAGDDVLYDGSGNDKLYGQSGNDTLVSREGGTDHLYGGSGNNTFLGYYFSIYPENRHTHYHLQGKNDQVWDNGIDNSVDYLHYEGKGSTEVHWFGGAKNTIYDPENYALPPFHSFGATDKVVFENVYVHGNKIDNLTEFKQMISKGWINYDHTTIASNDVPGWYYPPDGTSTVGNWDVGNIVLDLGPASDGTARTLSFYQTSLSGTEGVNSFSPADWLFV